MGEPFVLADETYLTIKSWTDRFPDLAAGFTTRNGGVSEKPYDGLNCGLHVPDVKEHVIENRKLLAEKINFPLERWVSGEQVHKTEIRIVKHDDQGKGATNYESSLKGIDGLITGQKGVLCTAFFADCVPLYFFAPSFGYAGIAHAGWRGTVNGIARKMVEKFADLGIPPDELLAAIGPCISKTCYEVDEKVIRQIDSQYVEKAVVPLDNQRFLLDLKQLNMDILLQSGLIRHNIIVTNYCTFLQKDLFFSHRRDRGKTGRMLGFIGLLP